MTSSLKTFKNLPEEKQARVLSEATAEFADHGYHQASVNRIVKRLGIAKGSLFKYFGNKQGLFKYLFSHAVTEFKKPLKEIRDTRSGDLFERMEKSLIAGVRFIDEHPHIYRIYLKMLFQENFPLRELFLTEIHQASDKYLRRLVEDAQDAGEIRPDLDTESVVHYLSSTMNSFLQSYAIPGINGVTGDISTEDNARATTDFLRRGLGIPR